MADYPRFPLFVDLSGKKIVVVGGGRIALRRIRTLTQFTEKVTVVSPELHPDLLPLEEAGRLTVLRRPYAPADIEGAALVLAATDNKEVNEAVYADCKRLDIPVNVSSDRHKSDFYFPGIVEKDNVVVGITASGSDHHLARQVREIISSALEKI